MSGRGVEIIRSELRNYQRPNLGRDGIGVTRKRHWIKIPGLPRRYEVVDNATGETFKRRIWATNGENATVRANRRYGKKN